MVQQTDITQCNIPSDVGGAPPEDEQVCTVSKTVSPEYSPIHLSISLFNEMYFNYISYLPAKYFVYNIYKLTLRSSD
jgi:hypothetical protein